MTAAERIVLGRTATRRILPGDRGRRDTTLDLAIAFDPCERQYYRIAGLTGGSAERKVSAPQNQESDDAHQTGQGSGR